MTKSKRETGMKKTKSSDSVNRPSKVKSRNKCKSANASMVSPSKSRKSTEQLVRINSSDVEASHKTHKMRAKRTHSERSVGISRSTSSISSISSQYNLTTGRYTAPAKIDERLFQNSGFISQYGQGLYDTVLVCLVCPNHHRVALSSVISKGLFLPFGPIKTGESWLSATVGIIHKVLQVKTGGAGDSGIFNEPSLIDIVRIQVPTYFEFITRVTYQVRLTNEACHAQYCTDTKMVAWFPLVDLNAKIGSTDYLGPEPALLTTSSMGIACREVTILDVLLYCLPAAAKSPEGELLHSAGYKEADVLKLYAEFLQHCYPSEFMTAHSLKTFLAKWDFTTGSDATTLTRIFAFNENKYLNFLEFLLGLAAIDCSLLGKEELSGGISDFRSNYYFRYYNKSGGSTLNETETQKAMEDLRHSRSGSETSSDKSLSKLCKKLSSTSGTLKMGHKAFHHLLETAVRSHHPLPDIFHCTTSPLSHLRAKQCYPAIHLRQISSESRSAVQAKLQRDRELCLNCRSKHYTLAVHTVKMSNEGIIYAPMINKQSDAERMSQHRRVLSERYFTKPFVCNQLIDMIRAFATKIRLSRSRMSIESQDWDSQSVRQMNSDKIIKLCSEAKSMFQSCARMIKVTSPCYVIGDIHGNLHDLLVYEKAIWKLPPYFSAANYLFLGDYVDRGDYSVECIIYLFCLKLLSPDRVYMLRGNHEARALQKEFTFYQECKAKFGARGEEVWEAFNDVFDVMPLCGVIDESIFCAHGGIPSCVQKLEQILSVRSPLQDPENDSDIALELLWNDPVTNQEYSDLLKNSPGIVNQQSSTTATNNNNSSKQQHLAGFLPNTKRGTASYYSEDAVNTFLNANSLSHVIRAHEVIPAGYQFHDGGKCITVFSCSHYCGGINEAAVAFVNNSKIRVIKIDTE